MDKFTASLLDKNHRLEGTLLELKKEVDQYKAERDTLIDDLTWYKAKVSRLEWTLKNKEDEIDWCESKIEKLARENVYYEKENKALRIQSNTYFDEWQEAEKQRSEFNLYVNLYAILTNHIRQKAEANPGVSRYIDLVNYIDRLERADDER